MRKICNVNDGEFRFACGAVYDDVYRVTTCPHESILDGGYIDSMDVLAPGGCDTTQPPYAVYATDGKTLTADVHFRPSSDEAYVAVVSDKVGEAVSHLADKLIERALKEDNLPVEPISSVIAGVTAPEEMEVSEDDPQTKVCHVCKRGAVFGTIRATFPRAGEPSVVNIVAEIV